MTGRVLSNIQPPLHYETRLKQINIPQAEEDEATK